MGEHTNISWCDHTMSPWWGCQRVSPGCTHCFAEALAVTRRKLPVWGPADTTARQRIKSALPNVAKWNRAAARDGVRRKVFVASMCDVFEDHPQVAPWRQDALNLLALCTSLDVLLLTKRPENILSMVPPSWLKAWPRHVWVGTTVEDQRRAEERISALIDVPAAVRFLSMEPLLGPVDITNGEAGRWSRPTRTVQGVPVEWTDPGRNFIPVDLVICGGESGSHARPMHPGWARSIRDQCIEGGTPYFFKQWGEWAPVASLEDNEPRFGDVWHLGVDASGKPMTQPWAPGQKGAEAGRWSKYPDELMRRVGKASAGDVLDGRRWAEFPAGRNT